MKISIKFLMCIGLMILLQSCAGEVQQRPIAPVSLQELTPPRDQTPQLIVQTGHAKEVTSIAFSPDSKILASSSGDETVKLWHVETGKELRTLTGHSRGVAAVALSPDGQTVASGSWDNSIKLWDIYTGKELRTFNGHSDWVVSVAFSPDGRILASGSTDGTVKLWDVNTGQELRTLAKHTRRVTSVAFSPDGQSVASGSWDNTIILWKALKGKKRYTLTGHTREVEAVAFSPDGQIVASGSKDGTIKLWNVNTGKEPRTLTGHAREIAAIAFSSDGKTIASSSWDNTIKLWDVDSGKEFRTLSEDLRGGGPIAFSPNGKILARGSGDGTIKLWDIPTGKELRPLTGYSGGVISVDFNPNGYMLAGVSWDNTIKLWDIRPNKALRTLTGHTRRVTSVTFSSDGEMLASSSGDTTIKLWDVQADKALHTLTGHTDGVAVVAFSPDKKILASGGWDHTIKLWDVHTGQELYTLTGHTDSVASVAFSSDSSMLASGSDDNTIKLWDVSSGAELRTLTGHTQGIAAVVFSPHEPILASSSWDSTINLWDFQTGKILQTLKGHTVCVFSIAFSPDGNLLASGSIDNTIKLWDVKTGKELHTLRGHSFWVFSVAFSPDGNILASGSLDKQIKLWDVKSGKEIVTLIAIGENDWAAITPNGQFDASPDAMRLMHWVVGLEPIELAQLKERYYEPNLLQKLFGFNQEPLRDVPNFAEIALYPEMEWVATDPSSPKALLRLINRGGGIGRVVVFVNGKEVMADARGLKFNTQTQEIAQAQEVEIDIDVSDHPFLIPGEQNTIAVKAYNEEGYLISRSLKLAYDAPKEKVEPVRLWAIVIGISDYQGDVLDLQFSAKDAENMAKALQIGAKRLFGAEYVHLTLLTSPPVSPSQTVPQASRLPTRANIINAFEAAREAKSTDILVVYLAGHGFNYGGPDGDYYYPTVEARTGNLNDPAVREQTTLSSQELTALIQQIPALKQVLILDTCAAGRLVEKLTEQRNISSSQIRAFERMKDRMGLHILAGSAADAVSYEASRYGQGLLTYSLLMGIRGAALREEEYVDISKLFAFAADQVPALAKDIGGIQRPVVATPRGGSSFDIGRLTGDDKPRIPLAKVRPLVLRASFQNEAPPFHDNLALAKRVNDALREVSSRGQEAPLVFVDASEFPDAYVIAGRYQITEQQITVTVYVLRGQATVGQFTVEGNPANIEHVTEDIVEELKNAIKTGQ